MTLACTCVRDRTLFVHFPDTSQSLLLSLDISKAKMASIGKNILPRFFSVGRRQFSMGQRLMSGPIQDGRPGTVHMFVLLRITGLL